MTLAHAPPANQRTANRGLRRTQNSNSILFEEFITPDEDILVSGSDDELSDSKRANKRRRIEKLAAEFANGKPLLLLSARPGPSALQHCVTWNKRSSSEPDFQFPRSSSSRGTDRIWKDAEDHDDILRRLVRRKTRQTKRRDPCSSCVVEEVVAISACKRVEIRKFAKVSNVRHQPHASAQNTGTTHQRSTATKDFLPLSPTATLQEEASTDPDERASETPCDSFQTLSKLPPSNTHPTSKQVKGGFTTEAPSKVLNLDGDAVGEGRYVLESFDASSTTGAIQNNSSGPLPGSQQLKTGEANTKSGDCDHVQHVPSQQVETVYTSAERDDSGQTIDHEPDQEPAHQTTPEPSEHSTATVLQNQDTANEEDSQDALLRLQGIRAKPRRSWASLNKNDSAAEQEENAVDEHSLEVEPRPSVLIRDSLLESVQAHAGERKNARGRRQPSTDNGLPKPNINGTTSGQTESQNAVDPDLPVDMQRRMGAFRPVYTTAMETQSGTTPLQYRPRNSGFANGPVIATPTVGGLEDHEPKKPRRRVDFSSPGVTGRNKNPRHKAHVASTTAAPQLEVSFGPASSFAPDFGMALEGEHRNEYTDGKAESPGARSEEAAQRPTSTNGVPTAPQQPIEEPDPRVEANLQSTEKGEPRTRKSNRQSLKWPGTQAALDQAQFSLFNSPMKPQQTPEKTASSDVLGPQVMEKTPAKKKDHPQRRSQEGLPNTQQLIDAFGGFSTIKKPRTNRPKSAEVTPVRHSMQSSSSNAQQPLSFSDPVTPFVKQRREHSSLRYSFVTQDVSTINPPEASTPETLKENPPEARAGIDLSEDAESASDKTDLKGLRPVALQTIGSLNETLLPDATTEFISSAPLPSHQCAQVLREESDVSQTVDELARDVLGFGDAADVFRGLA